MNHITSSKSSSNPLDQYQHQKFCKLNPLKGLLPGLFIRLGLLSLMATLALLMYPPEASRPAKAGGHPVSSHEINLFYLNTSHRSGTSYTGSLKAPQETANHPLEIRSTIALSTASAPLPPQKWLIWGFLFFITSLLFTLLLLLLDPSVNGCRNQMKIIRITALIIYLFVVRAKLPFRYITQKSRQKILSVFENFR